MSRDYGETTRPDRLARERGQRLGLGELARCVSTNASMPELVLDKLYEVTNIDNGYIEVAVHNQLKWYLASRFVKNLPSFVVGSLR
jgi:hypothetical protein